MRRAGLVLGLGAALVLAAEAGLRLGMGLGDPPLARLDPATEYELVPSSSYRRWGNAVVINAHGLRAPDHAPLPTPDERRVLVIGDSVIYGTHFLDQTETVAPQLEARLARLPGLAGCPILALPVAVSSWGPENQAAFLAREGTFGAQAAVLVVSAHDLYDVPEPSADILPYRLSPSWTAIGDALRIVAERLARPAPQGDAVPFEERARRSLAAAGRMAEQLAAAGIDPILAYHPTLAERTGQPTPERARWQAWAEARGLRFLDLGTAAPEPGGYRDDIHPDAEGAARIAAALAGAVGADLPPCAAQPAGTPVRG